MYKRIWAIVSTPLWLPICAAVLLIELLVYTPFRYMKWIRTGVDDPDVMSGKMLTTRVYEFLTLHE